ncbi:ATP-binding cassette domain-containing protein [Streptomyces sp. ISL-100]|uniref:ATP-binding cassette domain-containing protein n=1 Tax=Streptomyces sp. ISL-100 TaxID=2819173 RepID=UPI001BE91626|nr:ATP-binding cassette domain-containing protein [Streptomyces sp. ISL-100]MBT2399621.1 ATP-binding cassette domain-containing protein [Streptomyces sp. ISL-100]
MTNAMELRRARVRYGPLEALHGVDLPVPAGGAPTVLLGRNGSGRTTVLRALAGTVPLASGQVLWHGKNITRLRPHDRARRGLCFVPDRHAVYASLTVAENLELALPSPQEDIAPALTAYPPLRALLPRRAGTLSGGEQRMLAVSRAFVSRARVVLLDEPTQGMSPPVAARTYELLAALAPGTTVVTAEQRMPPALLSRTTTGPVFVHELRRGAVVFSGEASELRHGQTRSSPPEGPA